MTRADYVARWGGVVEHGATVTFGLKELRISESRITLKTALGGLYDYSRSEVRCVRRAKRRWLVGKWFSIELENETSPEVLFGGNAQTIVKALKDRGWPVEIE